MVIYNPKTETLFDRDINTFKIIEGNWRRPEFEIIDRWHVTEKIDGTSVILEFLRPHWDGFHSDAPIKSLAPLAVQVHGRSRTTIFPDHVKEMLDFLGQSLLEEVDHLMVHHELSSFVIYGEAYGPKVQKGGGKYASVPEFRAFDMIAGTYWLNSDQFNDNCNSLNLMRCPDLGVMSTQEIIDLTKKGFPSTFSTEPIDICEGIVAKPPVVLTNNRGQRVMFKLKYNDWN